MSGADKMVSKAKAIARQGQVHSPVHRGKRGVRLRLFTLKKSIFKERGWRWCKLGGGASSLGPGSGPVMSAVSADGVEGTGESIEIESGDDHT